MSTPSPLNSPSHWRERAQEARRIAQHLDDPVARQAMDEIAQAYEQLAALTERKPIVKPSK